MTTINLAFFLLILCLIVKGQINTEINSPNDATGQLFTGTGQEFRHYDNLAPWGKEVGDAEVNPAMLGSGQTINLHMYFPYYGGLYNYTTISINGYISFATVVAKGMMFNVGVTNTDWPKAADPAMIAPYLCKQQRASGPATKSGVYYRVVMRPSLVGRTQTDTTDQSSFFGADSRPRCQGAGTDYVHCDAKADLFLDEMMHWLQGEPGKLLHGSNDVNCAWNSVRHLRVRMQAEYN